MKIYHGFLGGASLGFAAVELLGGEYGWMAFFLALAVWELWMVRVYLARDKILAQAHTPLDDYLSKEKGYVVSADLPAAPNDWDDHIDNCAICKKRGR